MTHKIKGKDNREIEGKGSGIITVRLVKLGNYCLGVLSEVLSFLDQRKISFCDHSRGSISHIELIIIFVYQAKVDLTFVSLCMVFALSSVILCHEKAV